MKYLDNESGFTIIEVVLTCVIASISFIAIIDIFTGINAINRQSRNLAIATQAAHQRIEFSRNAGFTGIPNSYDFTASLPAVLGAPRSAVATFTELTPTNPGLKQLTVVITYKDGGPKKVQLTTLVTQRGINR